MDEKQGLKGDKRRGSISITFNEEACNGCGICIEFCARGVLVKNDVGRPEVVRIDHCTECRMCELLCPEVAIIVSRE